MRGSSVAEPSDEPREPGRRGARGSALPRLREGGTAELRAPTGTRVGGGRGERGRAALDEIGKCAAREVVSIEPQVSRRITGIHFEDGADVKANDLLFTIDPRPYRAQLDLAGEASLAQAQAVLELAQTEFARVANLVDTKAISRSDYDARQNAVAVAQAQVSQSRAALATARLNLEYCSIRSPIDGRTGTRLIDLGNVVAASTGSLLVIQRLDPIYADFTVTEGELSRCSATWRAARRASRCACPTTAMRRARASSRSSTMPCRTRPARSSCAPPSTTATGASGRVGS
ncbi:MAG: efflux RND transporter periplasmic adaptor subunit [Planctomycetota bacterium]